MHHNNWEWCSFIQNKIKHFGLMIYNPVRGNQSMEKFMLYSREKWGGKCIPVHHSGRATIAFHRKGIPTALWLGADQTPPRNSKFWTVFLNREAPFFSGPAKIPARTNQPVFFQQVTKIARGKYKVHLVPLFLNPKDVEPKEILLGYVRKMEEIIAKEPEHYLWSHRRWKHQRPDEIPLTT
jgi:KDO2-lipid IV(A) lauroyltransferase